MTRSTKDHWCAENRPCRTQWLRQYVTQHHPCLQLFILLAIWADLLQLSASSNELVFHPLHFSLIQKELTKNTCKRRWEFSPKHSGFLMAFTDVKMRRKTLELSVPFIYNFPLIKLMYEKKQRLPSSLDELLTCSTRAVQCRFVFIYNILLLTNWSSTRGFLSLPLPLNENKKRSLGRGQTSTATVLKAP